MSGHRALLVTVGTTFVALSCCSTFAQPASPQNQGASPSQYTVNVSKGTIIAPPVNSARPPLPPDVRACLDRVAQDLLGGVAEVRRNESADAFGKVVTAFNFGQETGKSIVAFDPLHFEWASVDFAAATIPGVGSAYGLASDLVEAKVRWDLYQQGVSSVEERDRQFVAGKDQAMQQVNELLADNSPLLGSADPIGVMNSAVNQALNITTGRSLILVDPVDDFVASQQSQQALQSAIDSGVHTATSGGLVGADETGQFVSSGQADQVVESAAGAGLNTATAGGLTGTNAVGQLVSSGQDLNADDEVQISSELVDNQTSPAMSFSGDVVVDDGPLMRPQAPASPSSGGFWNWQNMLQIGIAALQAYSLYEANQTHAPAATRSGRKQQAQSSAGKQQRSCSSPEECAAFNLARQTCSLRNDCSQWGGPPPLPNPGQGCSIQCTTSGPFMCWGNAFTAACPIVH